MDSSIHINSIYASMDSSICLRACSPMDRSVHLSIPQPVFISTHNFLRSLPSCLTFCSSCHIIPLHQPTSFHLSYPPPLILMFLLSSTHPSSSISTIHLALRLQFIVGMSTCPFHHLRQLPTALQSHRWRPQSPLLGRRNCSHRGCS